jgi:5'-phosphate synthase pdxT subunit
VSRPRAPVVGVLALQGAFREHIAALHSLGVAALPVRDRGELDAVDAVVLPGGESTTMDKLLRKFDVQAPLRERIAAGMPVMATCAGLILVAADVAAGLPDQESLGVLGLRVRRNAYGRQLDSFEADLDVSFLDAPFHGVFIRAPVIESFDPAVHVYARVGETPVMVGSGSILAMTFHPELTGDNRIHRFFVEGLEGVRDERAEAS